MRLRISPPRVQVDIFTFSVLRNAATALSPHPPTLRLRETCIIIYCSLLWGEKDESGKKSAIVISVSGARRYPIFLSCWIHLYLYCNNEFMSTHNMAMRKCTLLSNSILFSSFVIYLRVLIAT